MKTFIYYYHYNDSMKLELINPYVIKIIIVAREKDSISSISKRINLSYGWTHKWISDLIKEGVFSEKWRGLIINKKNMTYKRILEFIKKNFSKDINFHYQILPLLNIKYCFTKTDAVYIWTNGGYNISRYKNYYPIFIKIYKSDYNIFLSYCKKLGLKINSKKGIFYCIEIVNNLECITKDNYQVETLGYTIKFMKKYIYNFQPALEMIKELYNKKLNIKYREINTNA